MNLIKKIVALAVVAGIVYFAYTYISENGVPTKDELTELGNQASDKVHTELEKVDYQIETNTIFDENREFIESTGEKIQLGADAVNLSLELGGFGVEIKESEDDNFYIQLDGNGKVQAYTEENTLYVKAVRTVSNQEESLKSKIQLFAPTNKSLETVTAKLGAGLLDMGQMEAEEMELEVGAGQLKGSGNAVNRMKLKVGMGAATMKESSVHQLEAEVGMGALLLEGDISETADLECSMGSIKLTLAGEETDFNYDLEGAAGNVVIGEKKYSGMTQEENLYNGAVKDMDIECAVGSVVVEFE